MFSSTILLNEAEIIAFQQKQIMLSEEFSYESFISWAARKLKGYSVKEIDHLAKRVVSIDTHEEKTDVIERIREAIESGNKELEKKKEQVSKDENNEAIKNEEKYMEEHLEILRVLLSKAQSFNIVSHLEAKKGTGSPENKEKESYNISDKT